ncbi:hypothetical protein J6I90_07760 [Pseudidiomarina sp. 1APP75-32.1]|uniref:Anti-sigma factor n=1 Tax=Pseudidiomarina terrestris TaxID=2820060 RepID=A0AAW7R0Z0_9GAMM|nr:MULTISPECIES: DVU3141 family protein [unclassified Pseudidiomarina]MDN7124773.1 hypothetical protein [Pseudidiomarina sp. 1APP75-32.1]MDN7125830.1 hypothetical protein [Pseudidiomarina sp. 1APR75-33.1]MDN7129753.1 hypothetical protein [Pseudidiomarina sp. 1APR75-15]
MKITDEQLSAFLDNELPAAEMQMIRDRVATDEAVAERLAQLAEIDQVVSSHAERLLSTPMPKSVLNLLQDNAEKPRSWLTKLTHFSWPSAAIAATVAVVVTLQLTSSRQVNQDAPWQTIATVLETQPSGSSYKRAGVEVLPRFTFVAQDGKFCRQYRVTQTTTAAEAIACRSESGEWQEVARHTALAGSSSKDFQTATAAQSLDPLLMQLMSSAPLVGKPEQRLLDADWQLPAEEQTQ